MLKNEQNNNRRTKKMNNNVALFHIFPLQSTANPCFSSLRGNREEQESEQSGEAFSELSLGQSDQEGAIECLSERERQREGGRQRRWRRSWMCTIGLDMNAPQHSFPHIPFNFNSLIELPTPCCTHSHHAQRKSSFLANTRACAGGLYLHTVAEMPQ